MSEKPGKGTIVATVTCFSCGKDSPVKLDKNGRAYWVCLWPTAATGQRCNAQIRYPWKDTDEIVAAYVREKRRDNTPRQDASSETRRPQDAPASDRPAPTGTYLDYVS